MPMAKRVLYKILWIFPSAVFWTWVALTLAGVVPTGVRWWVFCLWGAPLVTLLWRVFLFRRHLGGETALSIIIALCETLVESYLQLPAAVLFVAYYAVAGIIQLARSIARILRSAIVADPWKTETWAVPILLLCCILNSFGTHIAMLLTSIAVTMLVLQLLIVRALRRALLPAWYSRKLARKAIISSVVSSLVGLVFAAAGKAKELCSDTPSLRELLTNDSSSPRSFFVILGESLLKRAKDTLPAMHFDRERLVVCFVFGWVLLAGAIVVAFSTAYYGLSQEGLFYLEVETAGRIGAALAASIAIFTTAPIAGVPRLGGIGLAVTSLEVLDGCLILVLLISVVLRTLPSGQVEKLDDLAEAIPKKLQAFREVQDEAQDNVYKAIQAEQMKNDDGELPVKPGS